MSYLCKLFNFRRKWMKPPQLKFSIVKDHDEPTILLFETLFCMLECFNMGTELPTKIICLGQTLVLIQMTFFNNVRKVGRLVLSRNSCPYFLCLPRWMPGQYFVPNSYPLITFPLPLTQLKIVSLSNLKISFITGLERTIITRNWP
jgi:hypothetical protein